MCVCVRLWVHVCSPADFYCPLRFQLLMMSKEIDVRELDFLLRFNIEHSYVSPLDFLSNSAWSAIKVPAPPAQLHPVRAQIAHPPPVCSRLPSR